MTGLTALDIAIGLVFVYLALSLVCSALAEVAAQWLQRRGRTLAGGIGQLLRDKEPLSKGKPAEGSATARFYDHPLIAALSNGKRLPSYIPPHLFTKVVLETQLGGANGAPATFGQLQRRISALRTTSPPLQRALQSLADGAEGRLDKFEHDLESWFNAAMERVSGYYRRGTQAWLFGIAVAVAVVANADTLRIVKNLANDPALRAAIVEAAGAQQRPGADSTTLDDAKAAVNEIEPLLGWTGAELNSLNASPASGWASKAIGIGLTAIALSLGAPFWFNAMQRLLQIRASVKPDHADDEDTGDALSNGSRASADRNGNALPSGDSPDASSTPRRSTTAYTHGLVGFEPHTGRHNAVNAYWLAVASQLAYRTPDEISDEAGRLGLQSQFLPAAGETAGDTQAYLAWDDEIILLAFRGTEPDRPGDILGNAQYEWTDWQPDGHVHTGFFAGLDSIWDELTAALRQVRTEGQSLWITGHSLGGALAALAASRLSVEHPEVVVHGLYTYGQPRVGDRTFAADVDRALGGRYFRYVNNRDIVPRVPLRRMGFVDVGAVRYFDSRGRLYEDPGPWFRFLDTVVIDRDAAREQLRESVRDHSVERYVELLQPRDGWMTFA